MRKFTLFLMSLLISVGAMAQLENGKTYRFKDNASGKYLNAANHDTHETGANGGVTVAVLNENSLEMIFVAEQSGDGFKLKTKSGYYLNGHEWNVDANSTTDGMVLLFESVDGGYKIKWVSTASKYNGQIKYFKVENVSGTIYPFCDAAQNAAATWTIEEYVVDYVHNTGSMNRQLGEERGLTTFTLTDGTNSLEVSNIQDVNSRRAPVYADKSSVKFTTTQGATLSFSAFSYTGSWMHAYAYIDYNKDFEFNLTNNNNGEGEGEIVSYNYYEGKDITGVTASQSDAMTSEHNGSKTLPAFTLPTDLEPGEYRMRIKVDWNNLDADYGASDIAANGGCQCDITLVVEESAANSEAKAELKAAIDELDAFLASIPLGNCITQYSSSIDSPEAQIEGIRNFYNAINSETTIESIEEKTANVRAIKESYKENVLEDGKFYHIRSVAYENGYVYASLGDEKPTDDREERNGILWKATTAPSNTAIWKCEIINDVIYFKNIHTASYMNGLKSQSPGVLSETEKAPITLTALGDGQVNFLVNGEPAHAQNSADGYHNFVPWPGEKGSPSAWYVEEATAGVQPHVLTVGNAGYATLMLGYNTTIPTIEGDDCGVFTATIEGEYAVLNEIKGVLPANTAVIVKAAKGEYAFAYTTETATVENNVLRGTLYDKYITEAAYVLGIVNGNVGFYTATTTGQAEGTFLNNAGKAYLPASVANGAAYYSFRFGEGTTAIENVEVENEVKAIYDLTGRRVEAITAPGIYIVNGKKVLVK